jgi:iron(III) transport system permease protein
MVLMSTITWGIQKLVGQRQLGRRAASTSAA